MSFMRIERKKWDSGNTYSSRPDVEELSHQAASQDQSEQFASRGLDISFRRYKNRCEPVGFGYLLFIIRKAKHNTGLRIVALPLFAIIHPQSLAICQTARTAEGKATTTLTMATQVEIDMLRGRWELVQPCIKLDPGPSNVHWYQCYGEFQLNPCGQWLF